MSTQMRDGSVADDVLLGRLEQFDERSRRYLARERIEEAKRAGRKPRGRAHRPAATMDQIGGSCVGFSLSSRLRGWPVPQRQVESTFAMRLYRAAQLRDPFPETHEDGEEGTSVLAGCQVLKDLGVVERYDWLGAGSGTLEDDLVESIGYLGGPVVGIPWPRSYMQPRPSGLLAWDRSAGFAGGHAIYVPAQSLKRRMPSEWRGEKRAVTVQQTWGEWGPGPDGKRLWYGVVGCAVVLVDDLLELLELGGEGVVLTEAPR